MTNTEIMPYGLLEAACKTLKSDPELSELSTRILNELPSWDTAGGYSGIEVPESFYNSNYHKTYPEAKEKGSIIPQRGDMDYQQPFGSTRYGLNIDKFGDKTWLGTSTERSRKISRPGEWPVAYHGTSNRNAENIVRDRFDSGTSVRQKFGKGHYCSPDPETARAYSIPFSYKGEKYQLIFQCRVNPQGYTIVKKETHGNSNFDDYWIVPKNDDIRPYGICVYKV